MKLLCRITTVLLAASCLLAPLSLASCGQKKERVIIYASDEDFQIEYMQKRMKEQFPQYDVIFEYKSTGDHAAILKSAGKNTECQITHNLEYGYASELEKMGVLANLEGIVDFAPFEQDILPSHYYVPEVRNGGAIILNMDVIREKGLDVPTSYEDLLDPQYKGLISMPNPKMSGTGYMFLLSLVNAWGEEKAFDYFDRLSENILSFTSSGSGPVNALVGKEAAIGFGMTSHAVLKINEGEPLKVVFFEEGSPYTMYGQGIIAGNEDNQAVVEVFQFLVNEVTAEKCERFYPEKIFADRDFTIEHFPQDIRYADMHDNTAERKAELLGKWAH